MTSKKPKDVHKKFKVVVKNGEAVSYEPIHEFMPYPINSKSKIVGDSLLVSFDVENIYKSCDLKGGSDHFDVSVPIYPLKINNELYYLPKDIEAPSVVRIPPSVEVEGNEATSYIKLRSGIYVPLLVGKRIINSLRKLDKVFADLTSTCGSSEKCTFHDFEKLTKARVTLHEQARLVISGLEREGFKFDTTDRLGKLKVEVRSPDGELSTYEYVVIRDVISSKLIVREHFSGKWSLIGKTILFFGDYDRIITTNYKNDYINKVEEFNRNICFSNYPYRQAFRCRVEQYDHSFPTFSVRETEMNLVVPFKMDEENALQFHIHEVVFKKLTDNLGLALSSRPIHDLTSTQDIARALDGDKLVVARRDHYKCKECGFTIDLPFRKLIDVVPFSINGDIQLVVKENYSIKSLKDSLKSDYINEVLSVNLDESYIKFPSGLRAPTSVSVETLKALLDAEVRTDDEEEVFKEQAKVLFSELKRLGYKIKVVEHEGLAITKCMIVPPIVKNDNDPMRPLPLGETCMEAFQRDPEMMKRLVEVERT
mgnify:CR=1 FL=1